MKKTQYDQEYWHKKLLQALDTYKSDSKAAIAFNISRSAMSAYKTQRDTIGATMIVKLQQLHPELFRETQHIEKPKELPYTTVNFTAPQHTLVPVLGTPARAGVPNPDYSQDSYLLYNIKKEYNEHTYYIIAKGDSMKFGGIDAGDWLLVDSNRAWSNGSIVIARIESTLVVKKLKQQGKQWVLHSENPVYEPIIITEEVEIIGVVVKCEKRFV